MFVCVLKVVLHEYGKNMFYLKATVLKQNESVKCCYEIQQLTLGYFLVTILQIYIDIYISL